MYQTIKCPKMVTVYRAFYYRLPFQSLPETQGHPAWPAFAVELELHRKVPVHKMCLNVGTEGNSRL
jgi:hypothetical protein